MAKNRLQRRRHGPRRKPVDVFVDNVLDMLDATLSTVAFGAGAILLGRALGTPRAPQIEIPAGLPPEIVAEWRRLAGAQPDGAGDKPKGSRGRNRRGPEAPPQPKVVQLVKGEDGIYHPEEKS